MVTRFRVCLHNVTDTQQCFKLVAGADLRLMGYDFGPPSDKPRPKYV